MAQASGDGLQYSNGSFTAATSGNAVAFVTAGTSGIAFKANNVVITNLGVADVFVDLTSTGLTATTSAGFRLTPGTSGRLNIQSINRTGGFSGASFITTSGGGVVLSIGAWKL